MCHAPSPPAKSAKRGGRTCPFMNTKFRIVMETSSHIGCVNDFLLDLLGEKEAPQPISIRGKSKAGLNRVKNEKSTMSTK